MTTTTKTVAVPSVVDSLIGAYRSHVFGRNLPDPATLDITPGSREIAIQPAGGADLRSRLTGLLLWAATLAEVTAEWWHTSTDSLHITVHGRTASGARIKVYGGGPFAHCCGLVRLHHGEKEGVSLDELYTLLGLLREGRQHEREVA